MKKLLLVALIFASVSCSKIDNVITIHAQTLPITKTFAWDALPSEQQIINYNVTLDKVAVASPVTNSQQVTFTTAGIHVLTVSGTNTWGTGPSATLIINIILPGTVINLGIK